MSDNTTAVRMRLFLIMCPSICVRNGALAGGRINAIKKPVHYNRQVFYSTAHFDPSFPN
jgi:hypothetical protein